MKQFHLSQKFLIVITKIAPNFANMLNEVFGIVWENNLMDSHVLIQKQSNIWSLYTFFPYQNDCSTLKISNVAIFTPYNFTVNLNVSLEKLYPEKLRNLNNCSFYVAPSFIEPFVRYRRNSRFSDVVSQFDGIDINIIKHISKALNFQIVFKRSDYGTGHGQMFENGTVTENLALV